MISAIPGHPIEVKVMGGDKSKVVTLSPKNGTAAVSLRPGQRMVVSDNALEDEDLIPIDGSDTIVSGSVKLSNKKTVAVSTISYHNFMEREITVAGRTIKLGNTPRAVRNRFAEHVSMTVKSQEPKSSASADRWIHSLNTQKSAAGLVQPIMLLAEKGSKFSLHGGHLRLNTGAIFARLALGASVIAHNWIAFARAKEALVGVEYKDQAFSLKVCGQAPVTLAHGKNKTVLKSGVSVSSPDQSGADKIRSLNASGASQNFCRTGHRNQIARRIFCAQRVTN